MKSFLKIAKSLIDKGKKPELPRLLASVYYISRRVADVTLGKSAQQRRPRPIS